MIIQKLQKLLICSTNYSNIINLKIETLDNPGWNFEGFLDNNKSFQKRPYKLDFNTGTNYVEDAEVWFLSQMLGEAYDSAGDPTKLLDMLDIFLSWINDEPIDWKNDNHLEKDNYLLDWVQRWFISNCNGDWEHGYGINMEYTKETGWYVYFNVNHTSMYDCKFDKKDKKGKKKWLTFEVNENSFIGRGDSSKLEEILQTFHDWVEENAINWEVLNGLEYNEEYQRIEKLDKKISL